MVHKAVTNDQDGLRQLQKEMANASKQNLIEEKENRVKHLLYILIFRRGL